MGEQTAIYMEIVGVAIQWRAARKALDDLYQRPAPAYRRRQLMRTVSQSERKIDHLLDKLATFNAAIAGAYQQEKP